MRSTYTYLIQIANGDPFYLRNVRGLQIREAYPGGFAGATFRIGQRDRRSYQELAPFSRLTIAKGPVVVFDGEIRDIVQTFGPDGAEYQVRAYGHGVILRDNLFGPKVYADSRLDRWQQYTRDNAPGGAYSAEHAPEKYDAARDNAAIRISPKPDAVFSGATAGTQDWEGFFYELPKVAGAYVSESIKRLTLTYETQFLEANNWVLQVFELDQDGSVHVFDVTTSTRTPAALSYLPAKSNCKAIGVALKARRDQAVYLGYIDDGAHTDRVATVEHAGNWLGQLNDGVHVAAQVGGGISLAQDSTTPVTSLKDGSAFYPTAPLTRDGAAMHIKFIGRSIALYAVKWSPYGQLEYQIWDDRGASVTGPTTVSENGPASLTGTLSKTNGSTTVTGSGTAFTTELAVGDVIKIPHGSADSAGDIRKITAIASATSLTVDAACTATASGLTVFARRFNVQIFSVALPAFGAYTLTVRNLGTVGGVAAQSYITVDYLDCGIKALPKFESGEIFAKILGVTVRTTTATIDAALVAGDVATLYDDTGYGLSSSTVAINEGGAALPDLAPLVFDDPVAGANVLDTVCAAGSSGDLPLAWGVWEDKLLTLEEWDVEGDRGSYFVRPEDCEISHEQTIQQGFGLLVAPTYTDANGDTQIGADVTSAKITDTYLGRKRRVILDTSAQNTTVAADIATSYLVNHDSPSVRTRVTTRLPVRDQGGALIPPDEVRAGRLLQIGGMDDSLQYGASDWRSGRRTMIVGKEWDAESGTLTLDLGDGPDSYERLIAKLTKERERA